MFDKFNKSASTLKESTMLETMEFRPLKDYVGKVINVDGFFFTNGRYGTQVVVVGNGCKINMPARAVEQFEEIANDSELVKAVLDGHLSLTDIKVLNTKNGQTIGYKFTDR